MTPTSIDGLPGVIGTFMGRDALILAAQYLRLSATDTVLMPAYTCKEVLRPFLGRARVEFYDIQPNLGVDPNELKEKLTAHNVNGLVLINYFGFLQPFRKEVKQLCRDKGVLLIEDCAHSLLTAGSGETGDFVVYSFRKTLPVPDGGGLKVDVALKLEEPRFFPKICSNALSLLILAKSSLHIRSSFFSRAGLTHGTADLSEQPTSPTKDGRILPLSSFASVGLNRASFEDIIAKKRADFEFWLQVCKESSTAVPIYDSLPHGVCPIGFPIRRRDRDALVLAARNHGIDLMVHWRLPAGMASHCTTSHALSSQIVTLPVYPNLLPKDRETLRRLVVNENERSTKRSPTLSQVNQLQGTLRTDEKVGAAQCTQVRQ